MRLSVALAVLVASVSTASIAVAEVREVGAGQTHATIQSGIDAAVAGDEVRVHAGEYVEDLALASSGDEGARLRLVAAGDGEVVVRGGVLLEGSFWDIEGLTFIAPLGVDAFRVRGDDNRLVDLDISGGDRDGIDGSGTGNEVSGCRIHDMDGGDADAHCIVLNPGATGWRIEGNELYDCSGDCVQLYADGAERTIVDTVIRGNSMWWSGAIARMENAVDVKNADGLLIEGNRAWGFVENKTLVFQKGPADVTVRCNEMYDGFTGVEFRAEDGGTVEGVTFERNLMHGFTEYALKFDGTVGATVAHNTFVDAASDGLRIEGLGLDGGTVRNNLWVRTGSVDGGVFDADHNGFFEVGSVGIGSASDVTGDPLLDDAFHLGAGSPMIDAGADLGAPFAGAAPDLGFAEVGLDGCGPLPGGEGGAGSGGGSPAGPAGSGGASAEGGASADGDGDGDDAGSGTPDDGSASSPAGGLAGPGAGSGGGAGDAAADDGGCDCRVGEAPTGDAPRWLALGLLALATAARRRR